MFLRSIWKDVLRRLQMQSCREPYQSFSTQILVLLPIPLPCSAEARVNLIIGNLNTLGVKLLLASRLKPPLIDAKAGHRLNVLPAIWLLSLSEAAVEVETHSTAGCSTNNSYASVPISTILLRQNSGPHSRVRVSEFSEVPCFIGYRHSSTVRKWLEARFLSSLSRD